MKYDGDNLIAIKHLSKARTAWIRRGVEGADDSFIKSLNDDEKMSCLLHTGLSTLGGIEALTLEYNLQVVEHCEGCMYHAYPYKAQIPVLIDGKYQSCVFTSKKDVDDVRATARRSKRS